MITPVDLQTVVVRGTEISQNAAQILNAHTAMLQLLQSELVRRSQQEVRQVNPESKAEGKTARTATEEERRGLQYHAAQNRAGSRNTEKIREENKGSLLDVRL